jgi:spermidine/putrescine transport system substrate-binding protein
MKRFLLLVALLLSGAAHAVDELHLYNWSNYLSDETAQRFEAACHCRLIQRFYGDNQEMLAYLAGSGKGIDLVVPTGFAVQTLVNLGQAQPLDRSLLPNFHNLDPSYLNGAFDRGNRYSIPYGMTTTLIGFNRERLQALGLSARSHSWALIFDPVLLAKLRGRVMVLDSPRELLSAALMYLGRPANSVLPDDWVAAREVILRAKPYWAGFSNQSYLSDLAHGHIDVAMGYSSDMVQAQRDAAQAGQGVSIGFGLQREGNTLSLDSLVILKDAPRKDLAYQFINFLLAGRNAAAISNDMGSGNPNRAALPYIRTSLVHNAAIFPSVAQTRRLQQLQPLTMVQHRALQHLWRQIRQP